MSWQLCLNGLGHERMLANLFLIVCFLMSTIGCGTSSRPTVPVSGRITLDGKPLSNVSVVFQRVSSGDSIHTGMGSWGKTDRDGKFVLRLVESDTNGAVVGRYRVYLSTAEPVNPGVDLGEVSRELIPANGRDGSLSFEVPTSGTNEASFDLKSHGRASKD